MPRSQNNYLTAYHTYPLEYSATFNSTLWQFHILMLSHCMPRSYLYHHGILIYHLLDYETINVFIINLLRINIDVLIHRVHV
jgi:hypothetical protein